MTYTYTYVKIFSIIEELYTFQHAPSHCIDTFTAQPNKQNEYTDYQQAHTFHKCKYFHKHSGF